MDWKAKATRLLGSRTIHLQGARTIRVAHLEVRGYNDARLNYILPDSRSRSELLFASVTDLNGYAIFQSRIAMSTPGAFSANPLPAIISPSTVVILYAHHSMYPGMLMVRLSRVWAII